MKKNNPLKNLILITEVGLAVLVPVGLMLALGLWLRNLTGQSWILIALIVFGIVTGGVSGWGLLRKFAPKPSDDKPREEYDLLEEWHRDGDEK